MSDSKNDVKNSDYVGDAAKQEKVQQGPYKTEKVWDWACGAPPDKCYKAKDKTPVTIPVNKTPPPCDNCGGESWNKIGERNRAVEVPKPATNVTLKELNKLIEATKKLIYLIPISIIPHSILTQITISRICNQTWDDFFNN